MDKLKDKLKNVPKSPGVYQFLNAKGGVIYVGKAKNLRSRVGQYFSGHDDRPQLPYLMAEAADFSYTVVTNELESAFLENTLIKQYAPKYNIDLKDDRNYAFITIDYSFEIPQIGYSRKIQEPRIKNQKNSKYQISNSKTLYFGPYSAAYKIKNTLNLVRKIFPYCASEKIGNRPCFYYYMHRCPGVCVGKITLDEYKTILDKIIKFLKGETAGIIKEIKTEMLSAAKNKKFEAASRLRDQLRALQILQERQNVILPKKVDWDLVSLADSDGYICVNLFKIREGKLFDKENFVYELPGTLFNGRQKVSQNETLQRFLEQYYLETSSAPKIIYTQIPAEDSELITHIVKSRFNRAIEITTPQKGKVAKLINLGKLNAEEHLKKWLNDKAGNLDKINKALEQLKEILGLAMIPKRIECYDISNTQGTNPVGSMVVFQDGLPMKSQYRKFKIQGKKTPDDFAMMREMLTRRLARLQSSPPGKGEYPSTSGREEVGANAQTPTTPSASQTPLLEKEGKTATPWPTPDLIVIDGGKGQLSIATEVLSTNHLALSAIGLAKRIEEIFLPDKSEPIILAHDQPALQLLQRLRDEAHRFGITFHRKLRSKQAVRSALDDIPRIGPKTKKLLKTKFGTVAGIRKSTLDELSEVVGEKLARIIKQNL